MAFGHLVSVLVLFSLLLLHKFILLRGLLTKYTVFLVFSDRTVFLKVTDGCFGNAGTGVTLEFVLRAWIQYDYEQNRLHLGELANDLNSIYGRKSNWSQGASSYYCKIDFFVLLEASPHDNKTAFDIVFFLKNCRYSR